MGFTDTHGESCGESYGDMSNLDLMGFHMFEDFNGGGEEGGDLREDEELTTNLETLARQQVGKNNIISAKIQYK